MTKFSELSDNSLNHFLSDLKDFYIPYRDSLNLPDYATFGCEIEFNIKGYDEKYVKKLFNEGYSSPAKEFMISIGTPKMYKISYEPNHIIEVISPVWKDNNETWDNLKYILEFLTKNKTYNAGYCGSHVHAGKQLISNGKDGWNIFLRLWSLYEDQIITFTNGEYYHPRKSFYKESEPVREYIIKYLNSNKNSLPSELKYKGRALLLPEKYLKKLNKKFDYTKENKNNTIEFRTPNYTMNSIIWQNNINFFTKMMMACNDDNFDTELLEFYERPTTLDEYMNNEKKMVFELIDFVFDNDFDKYCFLRQYYKDFNEPKTEDPMLKSSKFWK